MARAGHNAKTNRLHEKDGTLNTTKHKNRYAPPLLDIIPAAPAYFNKGQADKWKRICTMLKRDGMLSDTYLELVERYCNAWQTWWEACQNVRQNGITFDTKSGQTKQNPAVAIEKETLSLMVRILEQFGYTPRAAMAIKVTGAEKADDDPASFLITAN